jgi:hypothetical protein
MTVLDDEFPLMMERESGMPEHVPAVAVAFGMYPIEDQKQTAERGTPWYKDVEYIKIAIPGDRNSIYFQPADPRHKVRFPQAYRAFKERTRTGITDGKPLTLWPPISRGLAWSLMAAHVHTVESLAQLTDDHLSKFPQNVREFRDKARAYIEEATSGAALNKAETDKAQMQATIEALQAQITALQQQTLERQQKEAEAQGGGKAKTKAA